MGATGIAIAVVGTAADVIAIAVPTASAVPREMIGARTATPIAALIVLAGAIVSRAAASATTAIATTWATARVAVMPGASQHRGIKVPGSKQTGTRAIATKAIGIRTPATGGIAIDPASATPNVNR